MVSSAQTINKRREICHECEHFNAPLTICKVCSCFMYVKWSLDSAKCPQDKWQAEEETSE